MAAEKQFENKVKKYLEERKAWFLKYWGGGGFTKSGIPDLIVCDRGVFMGIEVKAEGGSPSLLQLKHLSMIQEAGGYGILLYPKDFEKFKEFNEHKSVLNAWYVSNIMEQQHWKIKLGKGE